MSIYESLDGTAAKGYDAGVAAERERLAAVISPERLRKLADWFDADDDLKMTLYAENPHAWPGTWALRETEVQTDLRRLAALLAGDDDDPGMQKEPSRPAGAETS